MLSRAGLALTIAALLAGCGGDSGSPAPAPTPAPPNAAPIFTSGNAVTVPVGATGQVYAAAATDANGDSLSFTVAGGPDAARFQISAAGALSFRQPPSTTVPADQNGDNIYQVQLGVSDGRAATTLDLAVTVTDAASGFRVRRVARMVQPVFLTGVPGSDRVFVVERTGFIRILDPATGAVQPVPFLDVSAETNTIVERGLLALALAPDYATSRNFYVFLTALDGAIEVRRHRVSAADPSVAEPGTGDVILRIPHPGFNNHYGGWLGFGPDNLLYVTTGDGGGNGDPVNNARNRNVLLGKVLRLDVSGDDYPADPSRDYRIPANNPFAGGGGAPETLGLGLRNPYRASFDGDRLLIGDVGEGVIEEVDILLTSDGAADFGWSTLEGTRAFKAGDMTGLIAPATEYRHGTGPNEGATVIGGYVYRGPITSLRGSYIFADFVRPRIWSVPATSLQRGTTLPSTAYVDRLAAFRPDTGAFTNITSLGVDNRGNLYILNFNGEIFVLEPSP